MIENYFHPMDPEQFATFFVKNCTVRTYDLPALNRDEKKPLSAHQLNELHQAIPELVHEQTNREICHISGLYPNGPHGK